MSKPPKKAVVLLSGGLDSMVSAALAQENGFEIHALTIHYNQRHAIEIESAKLIAAQLGASRHVILPLDLRQFGGSALTDDIAVPKDGVVADEIPITYVPARNLVFLSLTLAWAEALGARDIFIGVNALDYSGYPDCRPEFIAGFAQLADLATKAGAEDHSETSVFSSQVEPPDGSENTENKEKPDSARFSLKRKESNAFTIHAPLQYMGKAEIVREAVRLGLNPAISWSCYDPQPNGTACGFCDSCRLRLAGFADAGLVDGVKYSV